MRLSGSLVELELRGTLVKLPKCQGVLATPGGHKIRFCHAQAQLVIPDHLIFI